VGSNQENVDVPNYSNQKDYLMLKLLIKKIKNYHVYNGFTIINVLKAFPPYVANGWGRYSARAKLTLLCVQQLPSALVRLTHGSTTRTISIDEFVSMRPKGDEAGLARLLTQHGSDKAQRHDYHKVYAAILHNNELPRKIFEIGLGTNNTNYVSTMGKHGIPGASLRAFRDFLVNSMIHGADIDRAILIQEDRIQTHYLDQTHLDSFHQLGEKIGEDFDIMIDDGLHALNANLHSLAFFLPRLKPLGWAIIEDVDAQCLDIWRIVPFLMGEKYRMYIVQTKISLMILVQRLH